MYVVISVDQVVTDSIYLYMRYYVYEIRFIPASHRNEGYYEFMSKGGVTDPINYTYL